MVSAQSGMLFSLGNDVLTHVTAQMSLDDVMFGDGNQTREDEACVSALTCRPRSAESLGTRRGGCGEGIRISWGQSSWLGGWTESCSWTVGTVAPQCGRTGHR